MIRKNKKSYDVKAIVALFGGKHQVVADYEKILRQIITVKAVEKWLERDNISSGNILDLKAIAEKRGVEFKIEEFIR